MDQRFAARVGERESFDLQYLLAGGFGRIELHAAYAGLGAPLLECFTQLEQCRHAAFVACGTCLDAAPDPGLFLGEPLALALPVDGLVVEQVLLTLQEGLIVAIPADKLAAVEIKHLHRYPLEEGAVVRDEETGTTALA